MGDKYYFLAVRHGYVSMILSPATKRKMMTHYIGKGESSRRGR